MSRKMPAQRPGRSQQTVETPAELLGAVERRFGPLAIDLACTDASNAKAPVFYTESQDSLSLDWARLGGEANRWCNPPFGALGRWAEKCALEGEQLTRGRIFLLAPASVGTNWFQQHVLGRAYVLLLNPRVQFVGHTAPFPKDLMLAVYGGGLRGIDAWRWRQ